MACVVRCVPVQSSWVYQIILTADCTLAVWYRNGVCAEYQRTTAPFFEQMVAAPSAGRFVRQRLYRWPYRIIRPPCPGEAGGGGSTVTTPCCTDPLATTLHATVNLGGGSVALTYDGSRWWMSGSINLSCGTTVQLRLECTGTAAYDFAMDVSCNGGASWSPMGLDLLSASCLPLNLDFQLHISPPNCGPCNDFLHVTVTT